MALLLCISTSERVLRMPFADQNQFFDVKTTFCILLSHKMHDFERLSFNFFVNFVPLVTEKIVLASESLFCLVEIHNTLQLAFLTWIY